MNIRDSIAFVTGANRGLGLFFARELLARGAAKVYAGARSIDGMEVDEPGIVPVLVDVTKPDSVAAAAARCADVNLLVNNAGIARVMASTLDPDWIATSREIMETNFYGMVLTTQAFAPVLAANGGGAIVNVLSDTAWFSRPMLAAYSASKSAAWSFTNATRIDLREQGIHVLGMHVGFLDTDMTRGYELKKTRPQDAVSSVLDGLENGKDEVLVDANTQLIKQSLSSADNAYYLNLPALA
ncbi:SDR family oxidoreductase [Variovorax sp. J31P207]|uniref:SDR family oxidoreductase n=1 Tax=Variovorax sp. J31P207 TaxID=3053510 RepID=UPI002578C3A3|nr:SDR family oxidoreductase [Variovorax sp. J31P207]MDM0065069.1 SDR family oxidoreductase [Variovorax sp. J31P207]